MTRHWSEDPHWANGLDRYHCARASGAKQIVINLDPIEEMLFDGDRPAYRALDAMASVRELEGYDGFRGAPRVVLALLQKQSEQSAGVEE
ncbi:hypothetical protein [Cupriavidus basilensis]|uniref:hypothetical protein n=1 Tax=Cupriavidus basilensis TaxID=68895 RepID=UPI0023E883C8|nr:hypothetical protein [Cupriavidus basilensis]MDF3887659.1 hypothetical protein [Cupriavidus basilensis]